MTSKTVVMALLVAYATSLPFGAAQDEACDNRGFFEQLLTGQRNVPDELAHRDSVRTAADEVTQHVASVCLPRAIGDSEEDGSFPTSSAHLMIFELAVFGYQNPYCNGGWQGGHYDHAEEVPDEQSGSMPWSYGGPEYFGQASSTFSVAEGAYHTEAYVLDVTSGKSFAYEEPILYAGVSDFYCFVFEDGFTHDTYSVNIPFLSGVVSSSIVEP